MISMIIDEYGAKSDHVIRMVVQKYSTNAHFNVMIFGEWTLLRVASMGKLHNLKRITLVLPFFFFYFCSSQILRHFFLLCSL